MGPSKRAISILLPAILASLLAACGGGGTTDGTETVVRLSEGLVESNGASTFATVSDDGRWTAFSSVAPRQTLIIR